MARVSSVHVTLLLEDLPRLAAAAPELRLPALERAWSRGKPCRLESATANHLRFILFGIEPGDTVPVAALTHANDRRARPREASYWLRVDPVTMWADMARVFMTHCGFADLDPYERNEVESCVREVLEAEGFKLHGEHPERWCIALNEPLPFDFTPLDEALGMDVGDVLPDHPEARHWRRVLNEVQVALHNAPVNARRRAAGRQEVNSVWFWGGGFIPDAAPGCLLDTVYSNDAVSRGLALINDLRLKTLDEALGTEFADDGQTVLIDWGAPRMYERSAAAEMELGRMEALVSRLLEGVHRGRLLLRLYEGGGAGRAYDSSARWRLWRHRQPLSRQLGGAVQP